jgi:biopolymer transport protein ExbB
MDLILFAITQDWLVLLPIVLCSVLTVAVAIERWAFYSRNRRDVVQFIHRLQRELQRGSLENAQILSTQLGGILGEVSEEGLRILGEQKAAFDRSFNITTSLATQKLEKNLWILGTIATISPYLGLFGTVIRILLTFGELSKAGSTAAAPQVMFGIGSALIATAFGLGVAIAAVFLNNFFQNKVTRYEDDFQLLKLLFLSVVDAQPEALPASVNSGRAPASMLGAAGGMGSVPPGVDRGYPGV